MITSLTLQNFKSFTTANLALGPVTLVVGVNASGKSNVRDAFRFVHGVGRGYSLAEILGEKWGEGGILQWRGIRGGVREVAFTGKQTFAIGVHFRSPLLELEADGSYRIVTSLRDIRTGPQVSREELHIDGLEPYFFDSHPDGKPIGHPDPMHIGVRARKRLSGAGRLPTVQFLVQRPVLAQYGDREDITREARTLVGQVRAVFEDMRFLDPSPDAMRQPSLPGQTVLGDRGENLSSVLQAICDSPLLKDALLSWVRALTPVDAIDFDFVSDAAGRVLLTLVEEGGRTISALSASDGTLRFLALLAALLGPEPARFYFIEELENGIHPTRLHLLLQLIEQETARGHTQVVATTHSPQLLALLGESSLNYAALAYRLEGQADTRLRRILDIPHAADVLRKQDLGRLMGSGWLEDAVAFAEGVETPA